MTLSYQFIAGIRDQWPDFNQFQYGSPTIVTRNDVEMTVCAVAATFVVCPPPYVLILLIWSVGFSLVAQLLKILPLQP